MGKLIPFECKKNKDGKVDKEALRMLKIADEIDSVILKHIDDEVDARDIAGLLAHRLGTLMRHVNEEDRKILWHIVMKVLREQAEIGVVSDL